MKNKLGFALFVLLAVIGIIFSIANFTCPASASSGWEIHATTTYVPGGLPPGNEWLHLYGNFYCIYDPCNCSVICEG
jgi:hypothetical protein